MSNLLTAILEKCTKCIQKEKEFIQNLYKWLLGSIAKSFNVCVLNKELWSRGQDILKFCDIIEKNTALDVIDRGFSFAPSRFYIDSLNRTEDYILQVKGIFNEFIESEEYKYFNSNNYGKYKPNILVSTKTFIRQGSKIKSDLDNLSRQVTELQYRNSTLRNDYEIKEVQIRLMCTQIKITVAEVRSHVFNRFCNSMSKHEAVE